MTNLPDPLEKRMLTDLPHQLDRAVRPFDAAAIARVATVEGRPSILRIIGATAAVAIVAVTAVVAVEALSGARDHLAPGASPSPTSTPAASPAAVGLEQLPSIQRADRLINSNLTLEEHVLLVNAHGAVVEECMQQLGWDFEVGTATAETEGAWPSTLTALEQWTFADVASAESAGYGLESYLAEHSAFLETLDEAGVEAREAYENSMSPAEAARYWLDFGGTDEERVEIVERDGSGAGMAGGGCMGDASRAVDGDIERGMWLIDARGTAQSDIWEATFADDAVVDALEAWRRCVLGELGFVLEDPHDAFDAAIRAAQSGDYERERLIATTDAQCKAESSLDLAVQAAFLAATNALLPEFEDDLIALQQFEQEALARAKEILNFGD